MVLVKIQFGPVQETTPTTLTTALPANHINITYKSRVALTRQVEALWEALTWNNFDGSQYIVVQELPMKIRDLLAKGDRSLLFYRDFAFSFQGNTGLFRFGCPGRGVLVDRLVDGVVAQCVEMGMQKPDMGWATEKTVSDMFYHRVSRSCFKGWAFETTTPTGQVEGKVPDDCFFPLMQQGCSGKWPTCIIESGVFESLPRLREDAKWWFSRSLGDVRIVLVMAVCKNQGLVRLEKWQLMAPESTAAAGSNAMPPLRQQTADSQRLYMSQLAVATSRSVGGDAIVLPFQALFNRPPREKETDIQIDDKTLIDLVSTC